MNIDRLVVFAAVAKHRNISRASKALHISQPAVTKQMKILENEYSTTLFTRGGRGVQLTERGKIFLRDVRRLIKRYEKLKEKFGAVTSDSSVRSLTVGGSYTPSAVLLPSLLARFRKKHPQVELNLRTENRLNIERLILNNEVELAVLNNPPSNYRLDMEPYRREPLVAFVSPRHPLAGRKRLTWTDFGRLDFVIRQPLGGKGTTTQFLECAKKAGVKLKVVMHCENPQEVKAAVAKGVGVGILFKDVVADEFKKREFKELKLPIEKFEGQSFIVYHKNRPCSPLAQEFLALLRQHNH